MYPYLLTNTCTFNDIYSQRTVALTVSEEGVFTPLLVLHLYTIKLSGVPGLLTFTIMSDIIYHAFCSERGSGRGSGLMVSALDSGASGPVLSPGLGHCVVFLGKTLYSHGASLRPGV